MSTSSTRIEAARALCTFPRYFDAQSFLTDVQNNVPMESILLHSGYMNRASLARALVKYAPQKPKGITFMDYIKMLVGDPDPPKERTFRFRKSSTGDPDYEYVN